MGKLHRSWSRLAAWLGLGLLLLLAVPLFLCMPVWIDASLYDLAAKNVLRGGVPYRDLFDTNLPGMLWLHLLVRGLFGWSTEALRAVDLAFFGLSVWLLARWLRAYPLPTALPAWFGFACFLFYFSTTEWSHCQRDPWMLPFALVALGLRQRQMQVLDNGEILPRRMARLSFVEGISWAAAFWIKPFVALPAILCWLTWAIHARRVLRVPTKIVMVDALALLAGGLLAAVPGILWLMGTGAWPYFWDVFLHWNPEYAGAAEPVPRRLVLLFTRLAPWGMLHVAALPVATWALLRAWFGRPDANGLRKRAGLLAAFYLGWTLQAVFIQKTYDYSLAPLVPLALAVLASELWPGRAFNLRWGLTWCVVVVFTVFALHGHPVLHTGRLTLWPRCWREGSSAELRDSLKLLPLERFSVSWIELERIREFLVKEGIQDGELTCYHTTTHPLYLQMGFRPTTPYLHFDMVLNNFPKHRELIREQLEASGQRWIVSDLAAFALHLQPDQIRSYRPDDPNALPPAFPKEWQDVFPWNEPIVFRVGRYVVHRVTRPVERLVPSDASGSAKPARHSSSSGTEP